MAGKATGAWTIMSTEPAVSPLDLHLSVRSRADEQRAASRDLILVQDRIAHAWLVAV